MWIGAASRSATCSGCGRDPFRRPVPGDGALSGNGCILLQPDFRAADQPLPLPDSPMLHLRPLGPHTVEALEKLEASAEATWDSDLRVFREYCERVPLPPEQQNRILARLLHDPEFQRLTLPILATCLHESRSDSDDHARRAAATTEPQPIAAEEQWWEGRIGCCIWYMKARDLE